MSFKRRATGRDEMLKRNQQRKKKAAAAKKPVTQKQATKTAYGSGQMINTPKVRPVLKAPPPVPAAKPAPKPAPKASKPAPKPAPAKPAPARQQTQVTRSNRNKTDAGGMRYTGGRGGTPTVSTPAPNRKPKPGTGRTGAAAAKAANRTSKPASKPMTVAQRRAMRLRSRRGR